MAFLTRRAGASEKFPAKLLGWRSLHGKLFGGISLRVDKLRWMKILVNGCHLCKRAAETCSHLLLRCLFAHCLWSLAYSLLGLRWVVVGSMGDELWAWKRIQSGKHSGMLIPLATFLAIWREKQEGLRKATIIL